MTSAKSQKLWLVIVKMGKNNARRATPASTRNELNNFVSCKRSQEEMVGFAMIVIIVAVIILIFINFSIRKEVKEPVESYEVENFIQVVLQYTSECEDYMGYLPLQKVIIKCNDYEKCLDGKEACEVLNETLTQITEEGWKFGNNSLTKGYYLNITDGEKTILFLERGNTTSNYKGATQILGKDNLQVKFTSYY